MLPVAPFISLFIGGTVNTCYNALDSARRPGPRNQPALIYDSAVARTIKTFSLSRVVGSSGAFCRSADASGDSKRRPGHHLYAMVPEAVIAMLACARIGAIHFGGLRRICRPRVGQSHQ